MHKKLKEVRDEMRGVSSGKCERCDAEREPTFRFCKNCLKYIKSEMKESGYIDTRGYGFPKGSNRTREMKEKQRETRRGLD